MPKRKQNKSFKGVFAYKNSKDRQRQYDNFLLSFPELANYVRNFDSSSMKYLLLQGAAPKKMQAITEFLGAEAVKQGIYDFLSIRTVDCSTSSYKDIQQMIFEDTEEDMKQIEIIMKKYLLSLINHKQGRYKYPEMQYRIEKTDYSKIGIFTEKGLEKLTHLTGNILKEDSNPLSKAIYVNVLKELFGLFFDGSSFIKFKFVGLLFLSKENSITFGKTKEGRPCLVVGIAKAGENTEDLQAVYGEQFEIISHERTKIKDSQQEKQVVETDVGEKSTLHHSEPQGRTEDEIPPGTKWSDIEMFFTDKEKKTINISVNGKISFTRSYGDMGFENTQSRNSLVSWDTLKSFTLSENNEIPSSGNEYKKFAKQAYGLVPIKVGSIFDRIAEIREKLSIHFGISENPIPYIKEKRVYQTLFRIKDKSYTEEHKKSKQKEESVKCDKCDGLIKNHTNIDENGKYICDKCKNASFDRLSKENTYNNYPEDE